MTMQTFTPIEYLKIDIANNMGLDKQDWNDRIKWFDDNVSQLDKLVSKAEEPALFYAGVQAYYKALSGSPSGYPISLDATASGIQLLAVLTGDRKAAELCNVVDAGKRMDAYTALYHVMLDKIGEGAKIDRKGTKEAIMTAFYSSTAVPKRIFGEGALLDTFYETMAEACPGAWELNETMLAIWDDNALINEWILPDNFHVKIKVMGSVNDMVHFLNEPFEVTYSINKPIERGRSLGANMVHSVDGMIVRELARRCMYDPHQIARLKHDLLYARHGHSERDEDDQMVQLLWSHYQESGFLSARIFDHLSAKNMGHIKPEAIITLIGSLPKKPFQLLTVHD